MAEVTITTQPGELPAYLAAVSSGGPRPGVVVIHDGAGMSDDLERKVKWLAGDGFCAAPARSTSLSVAESDGSTDRAGPRAMVPVKVDDTTASQSILIAGDDR